MNVWEQKRESMYSLCEWVQVSEFHRVALYAGFWGLNGPWHHREDLYMSLNIHFGEIIRTY